MRFILSPEYHQQMLRVSDHAPDCYVRPGEYLRFSVQYGVIHAGSAYLEVPDSEQVHGHPSVLLQARAESNALSGPHEIGVPTRTAAQKR